MRTDGRRNDQLRPVKITPGSIEFPEGSALIEMGKTRVLCAASVQPGVPRWLDGQGQGWLTAEYAMLPRATATRTPREATPSARSQEIRRLIGRSLRAGFAELVHIFGARQHRRFDSDRAMVPGLSLHRGASLVGFSGGANRVPERSNRSQMISHSARGRA